MVKNTNGGSGHKKQARSKMSTTTTNRVLRLQKEEGEMYACVTKIFGGDRCLALGLDNKPRNCIIRGKFRGNNKRKGFLRIGSVVLIGSRDWQSKSTIEMETCDLLEVYADYELDELKTRVHANWGLFARYLENIAAGADMDQARAEADNRNDDPMTFAFMSESAEEYMELMNKTKAKKSTCISGEDLISNSNSISETKEIENINNENSKDVENVTSTSSSSINSTSSISQSQKEKNKISSLFPSRSTSASSSSSSSSSISFSTLSEQELLSQEVKLEYNEHGKINFDFI